MRSALLVWLTVAAALLVSGSSGVAAAPAPMVPCVFQLGFSTLHALMPRIVGDCTGDEIHNPANGDALQPTTHGLLVWRKADNWTAFTDGETTWINGPCGLQSRPNAARFPWELGQTACTSPPPSTPPPPDATPARLSSTLAQLRAAGPLGASLADVPAATGVRVTLADLPGAWGAYDGRHNLIALSPGVVADSTQAAATVLAHELTHARQQRQGVSDCVEREVEATRNEAQIWQTLTGGWWPSNTPLRFQENLLLAQYLAGGDAALNDWIVSNAGYQHECNLAG